MLLRLNQALFKGITHLLMFSEAARLHHCWPPHAKMTAEATQQQLKACIMEVPAAKRAHCCIIVSAWAA